MFTCPDYSSTIERGDYEHNLIYRALRKIYNAYIPFYFHTKNRYYLELTVKWFSKYVLDKIGTVYDCYVAKLSKEYDKPDNNYLTCNELDVVVKNVHPKPTSPQTAAEPIVNIN